MLSDFPAGKEDAGEVSRENLVVIGAGEDFAGLRMVMPCEFTSASIRPCSAIVRLMTSGKRFGVRHVGTVAVVLSSTGGERGIYLGDFGARLADRHNGRSGILERERNLPADTAGATEDEGNFALKRETIGVLNRHLLITGYATLKRRKTSSLISMPSPGPCGG